MKPLAKWALAGAGALAAYHFVLSAKETRERWVADARAIAYCKSVGKPYLVIGRQIHSWDPDHGDTTLDINPDVLNQPGGIVGDVRKMPFLDKQFGCCYNAHVLEHLYSIEDVRLAVSECIRVADYAAFLCPSPYSLTNFIHPTHHLRVWFDQGSESLFVSDNNWRLPLLIGSDKDLAPISARQLFETNRVPAVLPR